jgi:adenine phosphoribosyltransferase
MDIKKYISDIPDFPKPGILFRDISPLLRSPEAFKYCIDLLSEKTKDIQPEIILGIESRGFVFGAPLAYKLGLPFVLLRKAGKLPGKTDSINYALEYGSAKLEIQTDSIKNGQKVLIVDDLLATGGTALAAGKLVQKLSGIVAGYLFVIELSGLNGRHTLSGYRSEALISY